MDDGIITIYNLVNKADEGDMPRDVLEVAQAFNEDMRYYFQERTVGFSRQYEAKGVGERVDMLVRVWDAPVRIGQYAILTDYASQENENGDQYRIDNIAHGNDRNGLKITDISLYRLDELYEVATE